MKRRPGRPPGLDVERIARAALDEGLDTFSMPTVGRRLGVAHSGLYRYVKDRDALLAEAIELAVRTASWPSTQGPWRETLTALGDAVIALCDEHHGFAGTALTLPRSTPTIDELTRAHVQNLVDNGFGVDDAAAAVDFVVSLALTSALRSASGPPRDPSVQDDPLLSPFGSDEAWDGLAWHARKLQIFLDGLERRAT